MHDCPEGEGVDHSLLNLEGAVVRAVPGLTAASDGANEPENPSFQGWWTRSGGDSRSAERELVAEPYPCELAHGETASRLGADNRAHRRVQNPIVAQHRKVRSFLRSRPPARARKRVERFRPAPSERVGRWTNCYSAALFGLRGSGLPAPSLEPGSKGCQGSHSGSVGDGRPTSKFRGVTDGPRAGAA